MTQSETLPDPATTEEGLPVLVIDHDKDAALSAVAKSQSPARRVLSRLSSRLFVIPIVMLTLFSGGVIGLYFQPPGLKAFFNAVGLEPGAGTSTPIAVRVAPPPSVEDALPTAKIVAGLGRLIPEGDVVTIALPFGAGDARVSKIEVRAGDVVAAGDTIAVLDSLAQLQASLETAEATVGVREATLNQTREAVRASIAEAEATLQRSEAAADIARQDFDRTKSLFDRNVVSQAALDQAVSVKSQADREVERSAATLSRYTSDGIDAQVDVVVAARNLDAASADARRAKNDLSKAVVVAPTDGTVLDVHVRPGEKPGLDGVADIGNIDKMTAEVEVFQNQIGLVDIGQSVEIVADAFAMPLKGTVSSIGLEVGRQTVSADDPAANTDARIVEVTVVLDDASSAVAARFTNLAIVARIVVGEPN